MTTAADLLAAALKLPPDEREDLADRILDSLGPPPDRDIDRMTTDEELLAELDRRREESLRDPSVMIPWEEVRRQLQEEFGDAGPRSPARPRGGAPGGHVPPPPQPGAGDAVPGRGG